MSQPPEDEHSAKSDKTSRVYLLGWLVSPFAVFAFYVLSAGPVFKFALAGYIPMAVATTVYAPLESLSEASPAFEDFCDWYGDKVWRLHYCDLPAIPLPQTNSPPTQ